MIRYSLESNTPLSNEILIISDEKITVCDFLCSNEILKWKKDPTYIMKTCGPMVGTVKNPHTLYFSYVKTHTVSKIFEWLSLLAASTFITMFLINLMEFI